jgi:MHS family proline/betaine transporter-like MFS transporter
VALFGGMGPVIMASLGGIALIGELAPGYYLTLVCIVSLAALVTIRRTSAASQTA